MTHMTDALLDRFAGRALHDDALAALEAHLASCESCARRARDRAAQARAELRRHLLDDAPAPLVHPTNLRRFARNRLDAANAELVAGHLDECPDCARRVDDFRTARGAGVRWLWLAAAVLALAMATIVVTWRPAAPPPRSRPVVRHVPPPAPPRTETAAAPVQTALAYADPEWEALVRDARESGSVRLPATLAELRPDEDVVRGRGSASQRVSPAGRVIDDARPPFSWPERQGAAYTVYVFDGARELARSGTLREPRWTPPSPLPRGRTLTWQVEAARGETIETIPRPPAPPARFRIASEEQHRELARARDAHPGDDLLLGILQARAGLIHEARASLRRAARSDATAARLLASLQEL